MRILKYHPDKNASADAAEQFRETKEAYDFLRIREDGPHLSATADSVSYDSVLKSFLSTLWDDEPKSVAAALFSLLIKRLVKHCHSNLSIYLKNIDKKVLARVYDVLRQYQDVFHIPVELLSSIQDILREPPVECILLNPSLDDLFAENVYKLKYQELTVLVPLWHQDLVYDLSGSELHVKCFPVLPENMELDTWNNLYVYLEYKVGDLFGRPSMEVEVGTRIYRFRPDSLSLTDEIQQIQCEEPGITHIDLKNTFDVSVKQNVYLCIRLRL